MLMHPESKALAKHIMHTIASDHMHTLNKIKYVRHTPYGSYVHICTLDTVTTCTNLQKCVAIPSQQPAIALLELQTLSILIFKKKPG